VGRFRFRKRVIGQYLNRQAPRRDGRSAIITAGVPGAGKTQMLHAQVPDLADYPILGADIVKDHLIEQALDDGIYDHLLTLRLSLVGARYLVDVPTLPMTAICLTFAALVYTGTVAGRWPDEMPSTRMLLALAGLAVITTVLA
jgi:hypothetical protein